jgi:hypothetical protein
MTINPSGSDPERPSNSLTLFFSSQKPGAPSDRDPAVSVADDIAGGSTTLQRSDADPFGSGHGAELRYLIDRSGPDSITLPQTHSVTESGASFSLAPVTAPPITTNGNSDFGSPGLDMAGLDFFGETKPSGGGGGKGGGSGGGGGGGGGSFTTTYGTGALRFQVTYDSSLTGARNASTIESAFAGAIAYFTGTFTAPLGGATANNPVIVNLSVGWGEVDNEALPSGALGASFTNLETVGYSQFDTALNQAGIVSSVPTSGDPLAGTAHNYVMATAEAKAIGLNGSSTTPDGWVGFSSSANWYFGTGTPRLTQYDFTGIAEHEISEAMGRIAQIGTTAYLNGDITGGSTISDAYTPFDLFRFDPSTGARSLTGGEAAQFSFNDMQTLGTAFNTGAGDYGDWAVPSPTSISTTSPNDAYDAGAYAGLSYAALANDTTVVAALGYGSVTSTSPVLA